MADRRKLVISGGRTDGACKGDRNGQFSIRINQQWRLCFEWPEGTEHPFNIEVVDYH